MRAAETSSLLLHYSGMPAFSAAWLCDFITDTWFSSDDFSSVAQWRCCRRHRQSPTVQLTFNTPPLPTATEHPECLSLGSGPEHPVQCKASVPSAQLCKQSLLFISKLAYSDLVALYLWMHRTLRGWQGFWWLTEKQSCQIDKIRSGFTQLFTC